MRAKAALRFEDGKTAKPPHGENSGAKRYLKLPCYASPAALRKACLPPPDDRETPGAPESGEYGRYRFAVQAD